MSTQRASRAEIGFLSLFFIVSCLLMATAYLMLSQDISRGDSQFRSQSGLPLTQKLIWVDVDGMRADFARDPKVMPTLVSLASRGVSGTTQTAEITLSLPAIKAWTTGVRFAAKDMVANFWSIDPRIDSIFQRAYSKQMSIAFSGPPEWVRSFGRFFSVSFTHNNQGNNTAWNDQETQAHARRFLVASRSDILVVHYINADMVAHNYGTRDGRYAAALRQIDSYIGELLELAPKDVAVLVIADHGTTEEGFHWEPAPEVIMAPFVLEGKGIEHVEGAKLMALDLAPTLAALLGIDFPSQSEGQVAMSALHASPDQKARWEIGYASARLRALHVSGVDDWDAVSEFQSAETTLANGDLGRATLLAQSVQRRCNTRARELSFRRSRLFMMLGEIPGVSACAFLFLALLKRNRARSAYAYFREGDRTFSAGTVGVLLLCFSGLAMIWLTTISLQGFSHRPILPFRYPVLIAHVRTVLITLLGVSLLLALLAQKVRMPPQRSAWWILLFALLGAGLGSLRQVHDIVNWSVILGVAVFGWRAILVDGRKLPEATLYACLFAASLGARRINTLESWHGTQDGAWLSLIALVSFISVFALLVHQLKAEVIPSRKNSIAPNTFATISKPVWFLLGLGLLAHLARFLNWRAVDTGLLLAVAFCLVWAKLSSGGETGKVQLSLSLGILAAIPLVYPSHYFPVMALAIMALCLTAKRLATAALASEMTLALFALAGVFFLFFGLGGDFDLRVIDVKRQLLLDPSFRLGYFSVARIVFLLVLQLFLPALAVTSWVAFNLRARRALWLRAVTGIHFFFLVQMVSLVFYLQYKTRVMNSLFENLSHLILIFVLYLVFHLAVSLSDWMIWSRRTFGLVQVVAGKRMGYSLEHPLGEGF